MRALLRPAAAVFGLLTLLTGVAYPALVTAAAHLLLPARAEGSLFRDAEGRALGSALIGQPFASARYLQGRPSATGGVGPYDGTASSGSNAGPGHPALRDSLAARTARLRAANPDARGPVPADLVTASASGLDPHISPAAAAWQVPRIAAARGVAPSVVGAAIARASEPALFGVAGEPRVNVLRVNLLLDGRLP